ncbi:Dopamine beta-hydroxylase [Portunus trituberculatus]|uniref:Dopamine beta-hydroxylase n=1 Tax=Portunus trituberculatus TaxID=210409 RepID=A0A5B7E1Y2_PORTR|nr:Dopamine beta-hydroxylase [Portunus trituberculatus]
MSCEFSTKDRDNVTVGGFAISDEMWELQATSREASWRQNYQAIRWTPLRSGMLGDLYLNSPLSMQCNKSSGVRFPGYWENIPIPHILHPLEPPPSPCSPAEKICTGLHNTSWLHPGWARRPVVMPWWQTGPQHWCVTKT